MSQLLLIFKGRILFWVGLFVFLICGISNFNESSGDDVSGRVASYPRFAGLRQTFLLDHPGYTEHLKVSIPRIYKLNKGDSVSCLEKISQWQGRFYCEQVLIEARNNDALQALVNRVREQLDVFCRKSLPEPEASLLLGMLYGSAEDFPDGFRRSLLLSATSHIIAVSGYNVNLVAGAGLFLAPFIGRRRAVILTFLCLYLYLLLVGQENIPALRATVMHSYYFGAQLLGARADFLNSCGLALLVITLLIPGAFYELSLQLSFLAVGAMYYLGPLLKEVFPFSVVSTSLACGLGTMPLLVLKFPRVYPWAILLNIAIAPFLPLVMATALPGLILGLIFPSLSALFMIPVQSILNSIIRLIMLAEQLPLSEIILSPLLAQLLGMLTAVALLFLIVKSIRRWLSLLGSYCYW